ncbi:hypothetical protein BD289DRAFT_220358 [Coniella lustricola]|uniref:Uncharacterized protein n=1 Tax=Coniella lustricola TaxID=2025994 RepID=A0A2T3ALS1_9PEZI|nr:hypothetical protein BD289DRAFT_220358 [Coniella lustricola]
MIYLLTQICQRNEPKLIALATSTNFNKSLGPSVSLSESWTGPLPAPKPRPNFDRSCNKSPIRIGSQLSLKARSSHDRPHTGLISSRWFLLCQIRYCRTADCTMHTSSNKRPSSGQSEAESVLQCKSQQVLLHGLMDISFVTLLPSCTALQRICSRLRRRCPMNAKALPKVFPREWIRRRCCGAQYSSGISAGFSGSGRLQACRAHICSSTCPPWRLWRDPSAVVAQGDQYLGAQ